MQIRNKLTLQFTAIVAIILILFSFSVFYVAEHIRYNNFKNRLKEKALNTVKLLIEVDEIDDSLLKNLRRNYLMSLPEEFVRIYEYDNSRIYKDDSINFKPSLEHFNEIRKNGELDFEIKDRQIVGISYKDKYVIIASARDIDGKNQLNGLRNALLTGNFICLLIILFSGRFFALQSLKPISKIIKDVGNISETNLGLRLNEGKRKDEIAQLAMEFNKMFDRVEDAFERQKRFVSNASHELRTPLTAITGEIEVILMKERQKEEYVEVLLSVLEETKILTRLSNGLLQLAQTGDTKGISVGRINIYLLVNHLKEEILKRYPNNIFHIDSNIPESISKIEINGNEELLKMALMNVIDNAFKFSNNKPVFLKLDLNDQNIIFKIIDNGIGIDKTDIEKISHPFYRGDNVTNIPGHGVGLSLSEKIIKLHEGIMEISSEIRQGTIVRIYLPVLGI